MHRHHLFPNILKKTGARLTDKKLRYAVLMSTARCGMSLEQTDTAVQALLVLNREFPRDRLTVAYAYGPNAAVQAQQMRAVLRARLDRLWEHFDLLSTPALAYGAPPLGEPRSNTRYMIPFNTLGWPAIVVPTGLTGDGLPLATQVIGRPWDEATVLRAARAVEAELGTLPVMG